MNAILSLTGPVLAIAKKEFLDILRDRVSLLMLCVIPVLNLFVVGYSINYDTKSVSSVFIDNDKSSFSRTFISGMKNTGYFKLISAATEKDADELLKKGKVHFVITIPMGFSSDFLSEKQPKIIIQHDGSDPAVTANALQSAHELLKTVFRNDIKELNGFGKYEQPLVGLTVHKLYNPEGISRYNTVPGLIGVILTIMVILLTCLSFVREGGNGTLVHIINSRASVLEVFIGKSLPYLIIGMALGGVVLTLAVTVMSVPLVGSLLSMIILVAIFNVISIFLGIIFAAITRTQLQAMQMSSFFFLLSNMLSGFISPFSGMPKFSQLLGEMLPLTYFLRLSRGVMLKNHSLFDMIGDFISLLITMGLLALISYALFHRMLKQYQ